MTPLGDRLKVAGFPGVFCHFKNRDGFLLKYALLPPDNVYNVLSPARVSDKQTREMKMTANKVTRRQVEKLVSCDQVSLSKGVFTVRTEFFYPHGRSVQNLIDKVLAAFPEAKVVDSGEVWKPFRGGASIVQSSHWFVKFTL